MLHYVISYDLFIKNKVQGLFPNKNILKKVIRFEVLKKMLLNKKVIFYNLNTIPDLKNYIHNFF